MRPDMMFLANIRLKCPRLLTPFRREVQTIAGLSKEKMAADTVNYIYRLEAPPKIKYSLAALSQL